MITHLGFGHSLHKSQLFLGNNKKKEIWCLKIIFLELGQWGWEDSTGQNHTDRLISSVSHSLMDAIRVRNYKQFTVCQEFFFCNEPYVLAGDLLSLVKVTQAKLLY